MLRAQDALAVGYHRLVDGDGIGVAPGEPVGAGQVPTGRDGVGMLGA
jgi:hypothetical protein